MYSEELETLIQNVLADGVITEKERAVLQKKAKLEDIDADEIDVYIDGELEKIRKQQLSAKSKVKKCPVCGEIIPALTNICPSCGAAVNKVNDDLEILIHCIEADLINIKTLSESSFSDEVEGRYLEQKSKFEKDIREARVYYGEEKRVAKLIDELQVELAVANRKFSTYKDKRRLYKLLMYAITMAPLVIYSIGLYFSMSSMIKTNPYLKQMGIEDSASGIFTLMVESLIIWAIPLLLLGFGLARLFKKVMKI